ncbi:MAG TPA: glycosyltransferase family 2 protein [Phycisphaerales bacterium]|nr:glycosyltransferase family 2 protein [Phycisphaerales bacterium]
MPEPDGTPLDLSVVAPAHNEEDNIQPLVDQIESALKDSGLTFEAVIVDDGSTDATRRRLTDAMATRPWLRCVAMTQTPPGRGNGQSAAFHAGFRAARGELIAVLDADLQNDPAEIPMMVERLRATNAGLVQGDRSHARKDNVVRRVGSWVGRSFRRWLLGDTIRDTGCSLRVMKRELALRLPLEFRGMHRFIPITARHLGYHVEEVRVTHRPRVAGQTKYGFGIIQRALPGLIDLFAVRYMRSRRRPTTSMEVGADTTAGAREAVR